MSLVIDLPQNVKERLENHIKSNGITADYFITELIQEKLGDSPKVYLKDKNLRGVFAKYADPALVALEDTAMEEAIVEKYKNSRR